MKNLPQSPVLFIDNPHSYTLDGLPLSGVTTILKKVLFFDQYNNVPEHILRNAAIRGSRIHRLLEGCNDLGLSNSLDTDVRNWINYKTKNNVEIIASEYLVSDNVRIATKIDAIDSEFNLYDYKTTYTLDTDYLSWQLSFCSYLFEKQTNEKSGKLFAVWLRNSKIEVVEVERKSNEQIEEVIAAFIDRKQLKLSKRLDVPRDVLEIENNIVRIEKLIKTLKERQEEIKIELANRMRSNDVLKWETDFLKISRTPASTYERFDAKTFEAENKDLFDKYMKKTTRKESIKITIKKQ